jgi:hypothetical protein
MAGKSSKTAAGRRRRRSQFPLTLEPKPKAIKKQPVAGKIANAGNSVQFNTSSGFDSAAGDRNFGIGFTNKISQGIGFGEKTSTCAKFLMIPIATPRFFMALKPKCHQST